MTLANFLLLHAVLNQTLYISKPMEASECFACFNKNESWPDNWYRMLTNYSNYPNSCSINLINKSVDVAIFNYYLRNGSFYKTTKIFLNNDNSSCINEHIYVYILLFTLCIGLLIYLTYKMFKIWLRNVSNR